MKMIKSDAYEIIVTGDSSRSLYSKEFSELMHTRDGAYEESVIKHIIPSGILELNKEKVNVLDVGFGVGYNILSLLVMAAERKNTNYINIASLEIDRSISKWLKEIRFNDERDQFYDNIKNAFDIEKYRNDKYAIEVIFGDARKTIQTFRGKVRFDAVFQDAFSPGKNPELWSLEYFKIINELMTDDGILTTYSSAPQIRRALIESGFYIGRALSTGIKKEGTLASKSAKALEFYLDSEYIKNLYNETKSTVYRDESMSSSREEILLKRIEEMKIIRESHLVRQE